jgi:hypothetical protein
VLNGAGIVGVASQMGAFLEGQGFNVVNIGDADRMDYGHTQIIDRNKKPLAAARLADLLGVASSDMSTEGYVVGAADITVIVGQDFSLPKIP